MDEEIALNELIIKEEIIDFEDLKDAVGRNSDVDSLPLIYTTRLDDMVIINSNTSHLQPREVNAIIVEESKPKLQAFPNIRYSRSCKKTYNAMKKKLKEIYCSKNRNLGMSDFDAEFSEALFVAHSIKREVYDDLIGATKSIPSDANLLIKSEVSDEPVGACKYSELLKLCRPCSVVLSRIDSREVLNSVTPILKIISVGKTKGHQNIPAQIDSSSDEEPLIALNSNLRKSKLESNDSEPICGVKTETGLLEVCKSSHNLKLEPDYQKKNIASFPKRLLVEAVIQVTELYSKECYSYYYNNRGYLLGYYKEKEDDPIKSYLFSGSKKICHKIKSCCWTQRDGIIQSLYPKVLLYNSLRFMRKSHNCPAGKCICCCQKQQEIFDKPDMESTNEAPSDDHLSLLYETKEMEALEMGIKSAILEMNNESRIKQKELQNLLENCNIKLPVKNGVVSLIDQALMYKKRLPKKPIDNRRLLSLKLDNSQSSIIVLRNYAADEREIYELNPDGELKSYFKLTCYNNTERSDVKRLLRKTMQVNDVICCWYKRENLINKLIESKTVHHSTVKYMRTRHMCKGNECYCCCVLPKAKKVTLTNIKFPSRPHYWSGLLDTMRAPPKTSESLDHYAVKPGTKSIYSCTIPMKPALSSVSTRAIAMKPAVSSVSTRAIVIKPAAGSASTRAVKPAASTVSTSARTVAARPPVLPRLLPKGTPGTSVIPQTTTLRPDNSCIKPFSINMSTTAPKPTTDKGCQFVGIKAAPTRGLELDSALLEQPKNPTKVEGDVLTKEVNTLVTSILERFKDVRLTINSEGKVAAALNTPVSNLSTVELKVLANVLSYAQSQVNSLGLNSSMNLRNLINEKVGNPQSATSIDPTSVYKAFGDNVNLKNISSNTANANITSVTSNHLDSNMPVNHDINDYFTKSLCMKNKQFTNSFFSLISTKLEAEEPNVRVPVIQNVFSLQDKDTTRIEDSSATVFYRKPANQKQPPTLLVDTVKLYDNNKKRKGVTDTEVTPKTKKIRVPTPAKLHVDPVDKPNLVIDSLNESLPPTQTRTIEINGVRLDIPLLSNKNYGAPSVSAPIQSPRMTKPRIIREHNFKAFMPQPPIISCDNSNDEIVEESPIVETPFFEASVGTTIEDIEIHEVPMKTEEDFHEEDDCILGV